MTNTIMEMQVLLSDDEIKVRRIDGGTLISSHSYPLEQSDAQGERKASLLSYIYAGVNLFVRSQEE